MSDPRKIIQISTTPGVVDATYDSIFALTDRGEVFFMVDPGGDEQTEWQLLPPLPQGDGIVPFMPDEKDDEDEGDDEDPNEEA